MQIAGLSVPIICLEPLEEQSMKLESRFKNNSNVSLICAAVTLESGRKTINLASNSGMSSSFLIPKEHIDLIRSVKFDEKRDVTTISAKDLFTNSLFENKISILVKIDVQGFEEIVLEQIKPYLQRCIGIIVETSFTDLYEECGKIQNVLIFLTKNGFKINYIKSKGYEKNSKIYTYCDIAASRN